MVDRPENTGDPSGNHRMDVPGVPMEGNRVIHRWILERGSQGIVLTTLLVDVNRVREVQRRGRLDRRQWGHMSQRVGH